MKSLDKIIGSHRVLVFLDLEATQFSHEMTAIGAFKVTIRDDYTVKKIFKPYSAYVKAKSSVGDIVTRLTGITDKLLKEKGISFREVQKALQKYVGRDFKKCLFVSYGSQDARIFMASADNAMDCDYQAARYVSHRMFDFEDFLKNYITSESGQPLSLSNACKAFNLEFSGKAHDAISDAYNLIRLYSAFLEQRDFVCSRYGETLAHSPRIPEPIRALIAKLNRGESVTPEQFKRLLSESLH